MKKTISILLALICLPTLLLAQVVEEMPGLRWGKLPNGLTYYIYQDEKQKDEVHFYLFQNVGAIVEDDHQNGLAHYLEHMAFNTTKHFPEGVMKYLRQQGIYTFNALTGINETTYQINSIPNSNPELVDAAFLILRDWCDGISLTSKDVEKERKIIIEEWRERGGVDRRMREAIAPAIYNGSKYSHRNVIGNLEVLNSFGTKEIETFYKKWYRPDLQCVVVLGDIDPDQYQEKLVALFSDLKKPTTPNPRKDIVIPDNEKPIYTRFIDKENLSPSFSLYQRVPIEEFSQKVDPVLENIYIQLLETLVAQKIAMLQNEGREEFVAASMSFFPLVRNYYQNAWEVQPYEGREELAIAQLFKIRDQIMRHGFEEIEFEQVKWSLYEGLKKLLESDDLGTPNNLFESLFKPHYLKGHSLLPLHLQLTLTAEAMVELEVEDFNQWVTSWMRNHNLALVINASKPEEMNLSEETLLKLLAEAPSAPEIVFHDPEPIENILAVPLTKGSIVQEKVISQLEGAKEWTLSNGARAIFKQVPEMDSMFYFVATSQGGKSVVKPEDLPSYTAMTDLIMQSGLGPYSRNRLHGWLQDKSFNLSISISEYSEGMGGNGKVLEAEDFFKYVYMIYQAQNFNPITFKKYVEKQKYLYDHKTTTGLSAVEDSIRTTLFPPSAINPKEDIDFYEKMKYQDLKRLYKERFGNAADFTFCIIGDMPEEEAKRLVETYIASLPGIPGSPKERPKELDYSSPEKQIIREYNTIIEGDIGEVEISYINRIELTRREERALTIFEGILQAKLFDELREKEHGTYNVMVQSSYTPIPSPKVNIGIHFRTQRDKVETLKGRAYQTLKGVAAGKFTSEDLKKVVVPMILQATYEADTERDADPLIWLMLVNAYIENSELPNSERETEAELLEGITAEDIVAVAQKVLTDAKHREIVVKSTPIENIEWVH